VSPVANTEDEVIQRFFSRSDGETYADIEGNSACYSY
jgi:hypothetical protein